MGITATSAESIVEFYPRSTVAILWFLAMKASVCGCCFHTALPVPLCSVKEFTLADQL